MNEKTCATCLWWRPERPGLPAAECGYAKRPLSKFGPPGPWMWAYADARDESGLEYGLLTSDDFCCACWEPKS